MKKITIHTIITVIAIMLILSCTYSHVATAEDLPEFYPKLTVVVGTTQIDDCLWTIDCLDYNDNIWSFYDEEGTWTKGDIANLLMWNIDEREEEHEIVEVYWTGYTENITEWLQINGWQ